MPCAFCQERNHEGRWRPRVDQKDSTKSHTDSIWLKPTLPICPHRQKWKIYQTQAGDSAVSAAIQEASGCPRCSVSSADVTLWTCPPGAAAGSQAGCLWALKCHSTDTLCFAKYIQFQMCLTADTTAHHWSRLKLGNNIVIRIITAPFYFNCTLTKKIPKSHPIHLAA